MISIIIPTHNRANMLPETLNSLLAQSYKNWECIIVDDRSTDRTPEAVKPYLKDDRFRFYRRPIDKPKGANACRNYGYNLSWGNFIKWFDSDDDLHPEALKESLSILLEGNDVVVFSLTYVDIQRNTLDKIHYFISDNLIEDYLVGKITYFTGTPTWSRDFLEGQFQLFDEKLGNLDDWDFTLRMLYENPRIAYINKSLMEYRIHHDSLSSEISKLNLSELKSELRAREKHLHLLKKNKKADSKILRQFVIVRYKIILRDVLVQRKNHRLYFFRKLLEKQIEMRNLLGIQKTVLSFTLYLVFHKGYKYLK